MTFERPIANRYGSIASEIYDLDKPPGTLGDTAFYLERLAGVQGEILEPACGSGRAMLPMLQAGHRVTGFDLSEEMLAQCRLRCSALGYAPDLSRQSYESFAFTRRFAAIVLPVGSFTLIADEDAAISVLKRFHVHLEPGGLLLIDIPLLGSLARDKDDRRQWLSPSGDLLTLEGVRRRTDWFHQVADYTIRYERWRNHTLVETQLEPMLQRFWGQLEFRLALEASGFQVRAISPDYRRGVRPSLAARTLCFEAVA